MEVDKAVKQLIPKQGSRLKAQRTDDSALEGISGRERHLSISGNHAFLSFCPSTSFHHHDENSICAWAGPLFHRTEALCCSTPASTAKPV